MKFHLHLKIILKFTNYDQLEFYILHSTAFFLTVVHTTMSSARFSYLYMGKWHFCLPGVITGGVMTAVIDGEERFTQMSCLVV